MLIFVRKCFLKSMIPIIWGNLSFNPSSLLSLISLILNISHILDNEIYLGPQWFNNAPLLQYYVNMEKESYGWKATQTFLKNYYYNNINLLNKNWCAILLLIIIMSNEIINNILPGHIQRVGEEQVTVLRHLIKCIILRFQEWANGLPLIELLESLLNKLLSFTSTLLALVFCFHSSSFFHS